MTVKKEEFLALKQGPMSVSEYRDRFLQLSRYAPEDVNTDAKRQYRFLRGLVDPLQYQLMNHTFPTFQHLIDRAIMTKRKCKEMEDRKRKISGPQPGSSSRHYRKRINFRGPGYFRRSAHENTTLFSSALVTHENMAYFCGPGYIFVGLPTKIRKLFSSVSTPTKMLSIFVGPPFLSFHFPSLSAPSRAPSASSPNSFPTSSVVASPREQEPPRPCRSRPRPPSRPRPTP
jgi:hypothetical protein